MASGYRLAACAEMLYLDLPFVQRVARIHERGFEVEIWDWSSKDLGEVRAVGATVSSMTGYLQGDLVTEDGARELVRTAELALAAADVLDCARLNLHGTGLGDRGLPVRPLEHVEGRDWLTAEATLRRLASLGERAGRIFTLENLNTAVDHPGVPFGRAADTAALVRAVDSPALRLNLDLYHAQIGEGNLVQLVRDSFDIIGEIQVADVPGRAEPGTGEIRYQAIAEELHRRRYDGVVALEGWASANPDDALDAFSSAFTTGRAAA